jgi:hypothetical protein
VDAKPGQHSLLVKAAAPERSYELPLTLTVEPQSEAALSAEPKLPTLRGTPRSTFDFRITTKNDSADSMLVTLSAQAPRGFQVAFKEGYGTQELTSIPIKAGESKDLAVDIKPPQGIAAGQYPVTVLLSGERASVRHQHLRDRSRGLRKGGFLADRLRRRPDRRALPREGIAEGLYCSWSRIPRSWQAAARRSDCAAAGLERCDAQGEPIPT